MKRIAIILALALALLPLAQSALAAAPMRLATAKDAPAVGDVVELEGKLKIYKKTKTAPAYAVLTLDEPIVFQTAAGESAPQRELEIRPTPKKGLNNKTVRARGTLVAQNDAGGLLRAFGVEPASVTAIPSAKSVVMSQKTATMQPGDGLQLSAAVKPATARQTVTWTSGNPAVATVDGGIVTAVGHGKAVITAKAANGKKATCTVTVPIPVTGVSINPDTLTLKKGQSKQLKAVITPANAANKKVTWESSNPSVATVSAKGLVKAKANGLAIISAVTADGGFYAGCLVGVSDSPNTLMDIWLEPYNAFPRPGQTVQLEYTPYPPTARLPELKWKSSDASVVTVDDKGLVTAKGAGLATIYVETGIQSAWDSPIVLYAPFYVTATPPARLDDMKDEDLAITIDGKRMALGMTLAQIKTLMPGGFEETLDDGEIMYYTDDYNFGFNTKRQLCSVTIWEGTTFRTHRGIGTGTPLTEVFAKYGAPSDIYSYYDEEEDNWWYYMYYRIPNEDRELCFNFGDSLTISYINYWTSY